MSLHPSMPTYLEAHALKLEAQTRTLSRGFNRHLSLTHSTKLLDKIAIREGLISALWQSWCRFVRSVVVTSCTDGETATGVATTSPFAHLPESHLLFVAKKAANGQAPGTIRAIAGSHLEPTWGDIDKAIAVVTGLAPTNAARLISGLSLAISVPDLQLCRNANAHLGTELFDRLKSARVRYLDTRLLHSTDTCLWVDPATEGYLWDTWVEEVNLMAKFMCA